MFLFDSFLWFHLPMHTFWGACVRSEDNLREQGLSDLVGLGDYTQFSGLTPGAFVHWAIPIALHITLHADVSVNVLSSSKFLKAKEAPFRFLLPNILICLSQRVLNIYCMGLSSPRSPGAMERNPQRGNQDTSGLHCLQGNSSRNPVVWQWKSLQRVNCAIYRYLFYLSYANSLELSFFFLK